MTIRLAISSQHCLSKHQGRIAVLHEMFQNTTLEQQFNRVYYLPLQQYSYVL